MRQKQAYDTHGELLVQRYKQGIQLVRPDNHQEKFYQHSLAKVYQLPLSIYFYNVESEIIDGNIISAEIVGESDIDKMRGKKQKDYLSRRYAIRIVKNNAEIMHSTSMRVLEESGVRLDEYYVQALSFKFPWYYEDNVIGIMGLSIKIDAMSMQHFGNAFLAFMSTGLLNTIQSPIKIHQGIYFSQREEEVLRHLMRGRTAKQIGERLHLSPRTIESYIENMKVKAGCKLKSELVDKFSDELPQ